MNTTARSRKNGSMPQPATTDPPVVALPLNDKSEYPITTQQIAEWCELYPAVDVTQQLRNMRGWLTTNPTRRKTRRGVLRFVTGWLAKEQDRGKVVHRNANDINEIVYETD